MATARQAAQGRPRPTAGRGAKVLHPRNRRDSGRRDSTRLANDAEAGAWRRASYAPAGWRSYREVATGMGKPAVARTIDARKNVAVARRVPGPRSPAAL